MRRRPIRKNDLFMQSVLSASKNFQPFPHSIRRIANDRIQPSTISLQRRVRNIRDESAKIGTQRAILFKVTPDIPPFLAPDTSPVEVAPEYVCAEVRAGEREGRRAHERVVG